MNNEKLKNLLNRTTNKILDEQESIKNLLLKKKEKENEREKFLLEEINKLKAEKQEWEKEKNQPAKEAKQPTSIYFCDVCQTSKNSKVDGEVFLIKISIYPNKISSVCPECRPNVVMLSDDDWEDF